MSEQVTQLRVGDESFLVASMIERCPKVMMLRELVKNAIEAATTAPEGQRLVRLAAVPVEGVPKLTIWNSGRGMNADELFRMGDIASSIRKEHKLDQNFGMGAKVAALPSNRLGMRYRSCHDGHVHEVMLGQRDGIYGRVRRPGPDGHPHDLLEVDEAARAEGQDLGRDWTEVVLFGNEAGQDTLRDPYRGEPGMAPHWLPEELGYKFFRIRDGVQVAVVAQPRLFEPLAERLPRDYSRYEAVTLPGGIVLHYAYDAPLDDHPSGSEAGRNALFPAHGACGIVYRDELYDVHRHHHWLHVAPVFGIPFAARSISVFVELPDDFGIIPDGYRQFVRYAAGSQGEVICRHFAQAIHANRPDWLLDIINEQAPSMRVSAEVYDDLNRLLRDLGVRRRPRLVPSGRVVRAAPPPPPPPPPEAPPLPGAHEAHEPAGDADAASAAGDEAPFLETVPPDEPGEPGDPVSFEAPGPVESLEESGAPEPSEQPDRVEAVEVDPEPSRPQHGLLDESAEQEWVPGTEFDAEPSPEILMLRDPLEIEARGVLDRAGRYYAETHQLFLNGLYPAVAAMQALLQQEFAWGLDQEAVRRHALALSEQSMASRVGRMLVFSLAKQDVWGAHEISQAHSAQALSLVADDFAASLPPARLSMQAMLAEIAPAKAEAA